MEGYKMKDLRVFISGGITHNPNYKHDFDEAETLLRDKGFFPVNITHLGLEAFDHKEDGHDKCMEITKKIMIECDAVCMLPHWDESEGATDEYNLANNKCIPVFPINMWLDGQALSIMEKDNV